VALIATRPQRTTQHAATASGPLTSFEEMLRLKNQSGYVVGDMVEAKHCRGGWHYCTIVGKTEGNDGDVYQVLFPWKLDKQCACYPRGP